jgi:hypothetical protein
VVVTTFGRLWLDSQPVELHHTRQSRAGGEGGALYRMNQPLSMRDDGGAPPVKERRIAATMDLSCCCCCCYLSVHILRNWTVETCSAIGICRIDSSS